eukprot:MONOS_13407.1-p1 / transcript=MONOS_13407.1 / gene=MONOS_13407 / organism=Monocercomonoides_exilis_PA203 / gene_product=4-alpha-glucanotransferase / transcript_product=4-alpha-glucanotransferase / location=Mono_scaffold00823:13987-17375(+) / protein_length=1019 / sequence_SO=supercontig / SO=protein_coding / is_pseudo=false
MSSAFYFFKSGDYIRWEERSHFRSFDVAPGEIVEVRDLWHDRANFTEDISSTSLIQDVCMHREKSDEFPKVEKPDDEKVSVVFEIPVPLISPQESIHLIGASKKNKFWNLAGAQKLFEAEAPFFKCIRSFDFDELPVQYKFVLTHNLGWECENIETGPNSECGKPMPIDLNLPDAVVWTFQEGKAKAVHFTDAIASHMCQSPTAGHAQIIFIESPSFRYPNEPHFRAAGVAIPVFALRSKQSLGVGEFADLPLLAKWCQMAGLRVVQLLPVTDTAVNGVSWMDSDPFSSVSSFALHPIYINIDSLQPLPADIAADLPTQREKLNTPKLDYEATLKLKLSYLERIFDLHLTHDGGFERDEEFIQFQKDSAYWMPSYAVFKTLSSQNGTTNWQGWPEELSDACNVEKIVAEMTQPAHCLYREVLFHMWVQFHLDRQFREASRRCACELHVGLKGDIPVGCELRSADTWYFRKYFRLDMRVGSRPDAASAPEGQNWGIPAFNWENILADNFEWWGKRLKAMERFFHACQVDQLLSYCRSWLIPRESLSALHGRFVPGRLVSEGELVKRSGLKDLYGRLTLPVITKGLVEQVFGKNNGGEGEGEEEEEGEEEIEQIIRTFLEPAEESADSDYVFREEFNTERKIADYLIEQLGINDESGEEELAALDSFLRKMHVLTNSVCLYAFDEGEEVSYAPRFNVASTVSWKMLGADWQDALLQLEREYFSEWGWHGELFEKSAWTKLGKMKEATRMLLCGDDVGLAVDDNCGGGFSSSSFLRRIMHSLHILGLRVQRVTGNPSENYFHPKNYSEDVIAATSTHDMPPLRAWWQITPPPTSSSSSSSSPSLSFLKYNYDYDSSISSFSSPPPPPSSSFSSSTFPQSEDKDKDEFTEEKEKEEKEENLPLSPQFQIESCIRDRFWYNTLCNSSPRPSSLPSDQLERIIDMHMFSPAMIAIFLYQDIVAILPDDEVYHKDPWDEVINNPDSKKHYWQYRMPCFIERLMEKSVLIERIKGKVVHSGRLRIH